MTKMEIKINELSDLINYKANEKIRKHEMNMIIFITENWEEIKKIMSQK